MELEAWGGGGGGGEGEAVAGDCIIFDCEQLTRV